MENSAKFKSALTTLLQFLWTGGAVLVLWDIVIRGMWPTLPFLTITGAGLGLFCTLVITQFFAAAIAEGVIGFLSDLTTTVCAELGIGDKINNPKSDK